jgi:integration host factor subunit alpha
MTKADIADIIHDRIGLSKKDSMELLESMLEHIKCELAKGEDVKLSGFGHFMVRQKSERRGRNPKTGEEIMITPRQVVTFRASQLLRDRLPEGEL